MRVEQNLNKKIEDSNKRIEELLTVEEDDEEDISANFLIGTSYVGLEPGDIILFNYLKVNDPGSGRPVVLPSKATPTRLGIVVTSNRTSTGHFLSTNNNVLLNIFLLDTLTKSFYKVVVNTLYLDEKRCDYYRKPKFLEGYLKKQNFRTLNINYTRNIRKVIIETKKNKKKRDEHTAKVEAIKVTRKSNPLE